MTLIFLIIAVIFIMFTICIIFDAIETTKAEEEITDTMSWYYFNKVLKENKIKTGEDFAHFMSVIAEHGKNKSYTEIKKIWKSHIDSLKDVVKSIKRRK